VKPADLSAIHDLLQAERPIVTDAVLGETPFTEATRPPPIGRGDRPLELSNS
jgi:hypothetical protein